ncbi:hypothetical protein N7519_007242 [Penicillium mononematosum]|uniref:uncharacterized protein n=1 Tax=Penicillium mononematosum TaxID=268346 RepID=UPI002547EED2|nr:uncharacterized protein N7519_007242 [Penicillium mononematosum]KAJ6185941.1 hypothetical protein N7519_007242 [Penicillium mononematosum]
MDELRNRLYSLTDWGYVIYRTTYSAESDAVFPGAISDPTQFNGTSLEAIRAHFEAWVDAQDRHDNWNKFRMCIIIYEETLQVLKGISTLKIKGQGILRKNYDM